MSATMLPLTLSANMALEAILGTKTETRRPVPKRLHLHDCGRVAYPMDNSPEARAKEREPGWQYTFNGCFYRCAASDIPQAIRDIAAPFGLPGEECWLREPGRVAARTQQYDAPGLFDIQFAAGGVKHRVGLPDRLLRGGQPPSWWVAGRGIPNGIFREAARFKSEVLEVGVERLQDITEAGAKAEGFASREAFLCAWDDIYGKRPGLRQVLNPWVTVTKFKPLEAM